VNASAPAATARDTGLRVIGVSFFSQLVTAGVTTYAFGYFLTPIAEDFGTSRSAVALGQTIFMSVAAMLTPLVGAIIDVRPLRGLMAGGALGLAAALAAASRSLELWHGGVLAGVVALGSVLCGTLAGSALVVRVFPAGRERALGLASVGTSAGGVVMPLLAVPLIAALGWRDALLALGIAAGLLLAAVAWLGIPAGSDRPVLRDAAHGGAAKLSVPAVLLSRNFWPITFSMMVVYGTNTALIANLPGLAGDLGVPAGQRAWLVSGLAAASLVGKLIYSAIGHRFDPRAPIWLAGSTMVATLALLVVVPGFPMMLASSVASGLGTGALLPAWSALVARCFGAAQFAGVMGLTRLCAYPLIAGGGALAALSKDVTGSYDAGFLAFLAASALVVLLPFLMRVPQRV
jgi:MFS family permease